MLIEQIIEFELSEPGSWSFMPSPKTGYVYDKTKISMADLELIIIYLLLKILQEALHLASPYLDQATCKI